MRRVPACALLVACAAAPFLWMVPASADPGYPPTTGGTGGGGTGVTLTTGGGGGGRVHLPRTGQDITQESLIGAGSIAAGGALLLLVSRSRRRGAGGSSS